MYFICFTVLILVLIWLFQYFFLDSYYETAKVRDIQNTAKEIVNIARQEDSQRETERLTRKLAFENGFCVLITDEEGNQQVFENKYFCFLY